MTNIWLSYNSNTISIQTNVPNCKTKPLALHFICLSESYGLKNHILTFFLKHDIIGCVYVVYVGRDVSVGITTRYGLNGPGIESPWGKIFRIHSDRPWGPPSLIYNGYRVFPGVKRPGRGVDHSPHLAPRLKKE